MKRKIAFFDIDGTITSEIDGSIPDSAVLAIRQARANGHYMFINTGRCFQNVESRFQSIGFDGFVCGCGTNIYCNENEIYYHEISHEITMQILHAAREVNVDICFESKREVIFDETRKIIHPRAIRQLYAFRERHYDMSHSPDAIDFTCDKFVIWLSDPEKESLFRKYSDPYFTCIDRDKEFKEFVPHAHSKATGIQKVLDHYDLSLEDCYVFGDSENDLSMLTYSPNSIVMGNAEKDSIKNIASFVTSRASENGIQKALQYYGFI